MFVVFYGGFARLSEEISRVFEGVLNKIFGVRFFKVILDMARLRRILHIAFEFGAHPFSLGFCKKSISK